MSWISLAREIHGCVPKMPLPYAKTLVSRAWSDVRAQNLWSFNLFDANWTSPQPVQAGLVASAIQGSTSVTMDATATAALNAVGAFPSLLIQRQFRVSVGTIYNVRAWDGAGMLTLDRPFQEVSGASLAYMIFQCYFPAPYADFKCWGTVRDMINFQTLFTDRYSREQLDQMDPQRTWYYFPTDVVPYLRDQNPASPTYGWPMFELWGAPLSVYTYQLYGVRRGVDFVADTDTLPAQIGEDVVAALARKYAYEWAEANKGDAPRNAGSDFRFLIGEAKADYDRLFRRYRREDREYVDQWFVSRRIAPRTFYAQYNSTAGTANPGPAW